MPAAPMFFPRDYPSTTTSADIMREHRARVAIEEETRIEKRRAAQAEQCADSTTPQARIRAWERLHGLRMPSDATHPIVVVIATETHLTIDEIRHEQQARKGRAPVTSDSTIQVPQYL